MVWLQVFGVLAAALVVFGLIPRIIFPRGEVPGRALDRAVAGLVLMSALCLASMYVLGTFGMLETFALIPIWGAVWWFSKGRYQPRGRVDRLGEGVLGTLELFEGGREKRSRTVFARGREVVGTATRAQVRVVREESQGFSTWAIRLAAVAVLLGAAALRYSRALHHVDLVPQDSFLALSWTTFLDKGRLLADGTYPQGTYMWLSMISRFYPGGVYSLIRFGGPLMNVLELGILYWAVSRTTSSRAGGVVAMAVIGFFAGNPQLLVTWDRQIGAMTNEFAIAFGLISIVFASDYLGDGETIHLVLAGAAMFVAVTSNTLVVPLLAVGYIAIFVSGLVLGGWEKPKLRRIILVGLLAMVAANYYFALGAIRHVPLEDSFTQYLPNNNAGFAVGAEGTASTAAQANAGEPPGHELRTNGPYQIATLGAVLGIVGALFMGRTRLGRVMLSMSLTALCVLLLYDLVFVRYALLFRTRMAWMTGQVLSLSIGLGLGALVAAAGRLVNVKDLLRQRRTEPGYARFSILSVVSLVLATVMIIYLSPLQGAVAREADPSGYPQADTVALQILNKETPLSFTFVGVSEQYQEVLAYGYFTEAWVFARDITYDDAEDPSYELPIPTDRVYIFAEKVPFTGPQAPATGPTQEYYRDATKRAIIMARILQWCQVYQSFHHDMSVVYEDADLRVYEINRVVDVTRAERAHEFVDYTWHPGKYFNTPADITADRVTG
jgi:hypothetical protein